MNTLPSSSLTIPPWPVRAPQKHRAGPRGPGGGPFQPLRCREVPPCSRAAGERGSVRRTWQRPESRRWIRSVTGPPEGVGEDQAPRPASLRPEMGCLEGCPVQMRLSRRRGNDLGPPHLLFLQSPGDGHAPPPAQELSTGRGSAGLSGRSSASRVPPLRGSAVALLPGAVRRLGCTGRVLPCRAHGPAAAACEEPGVGAGVHAWCSVHHHSSPACPPSLSTVYKKLILQRTGTSPLDTGWHLPADHWVGLHT